MLKVYHHLFTSIILSETLQNIFSSSFFWFQLLNMLLNTAVVCLGKLFVLASCMLLKCIHVCME